VQGVCSATPLALRKNPSRINNLTAVEKGKTQPLALQTGLKHIFYKFIKRLHFLTVEDGPNALVIKI
jgi:hypothetical protein